MLRPVLEMGRGVAWTRVRCGLPQTRFGWEAEFLRLALNASLLRPASEVSVLFWMRGPCFNLKRNLRVEVRFASADLTLVIFGQPTIMWWMGYYIFDCGAHSWFFLVAFPFQTNKGDDENKLNPPHFTPFSLIINRKKLKRGERLFSPELCNTFFFSWLFNSQTTLYPKQT